MLALNRVSETISSAWMEVKWNTMTSGVRGGVGLLRSASSPDNSYLAGLLQVQLGQGCCNEQDCCKCNLKRDVAMNMVALFLSSHGSVGSPWQRSSSSFPSYAGSQTL